MKCKWLSLILSVCILVCALPVSADTPTERRKKDLESHGFTVVQQQYLEKEKCYIYQLKHKKTGAAVVFRDNKVLKKTFAISFASQSRDNKGTNHVLEHALASGGSEKYPSNDLSTILRGNTVASMLNAYTEADSITYPFETANEQDYQNLLDIYLDMIFYPRILTEENIFKREGVRKEYVDGKLSYNGAVFNEMRAKSDLLYEALDRAYLQLLPNSVQPGGTTEALKTLTYEDVLSTYNTYYKPSNSLIYLAGDIDLDATLTQMDGVFKDFSDKRPEIKFEQTVVKPQNQSIRAQSETYSGMPGTSCAAVLYVGPKVKDIKAYKAARILLNLAYERFTEQNDTFTYYVGGTGGGFLAEGFLSDNVPDAEAEALITELKAVFSSLKGMDSETLVQVIGKQEVQDRADANYINVIISDLVTGWIYADDPLFFVDSSDVYDALRKDAAGGYFDTILDQYYINNPHQVDIILSPAAQEDTTDVGAFTATPEETEKIRKETEAFAKWAGALDSPEVLAKIPSLSIDDFKKALFDFVVTEQEVGGVPYLYTAPNWESGQVNATLNFDLSGLDHTQVPTAQLAADIIKARLQELGIQDVYVHTWANANRYDNKKYTPTLSISVASVADNLQEKVQAVIDLLKSPDFLTEAMTERYFNEVRNNVYVGMSVYYSYCIYAGEFSAGSRWNRLANGESDAGGYLYYKYLQSLPDASAAARALMDIKEQVFNLGGLQLAFQGSTTESERFQSMIAPLLPTLSTEAQAEKTCELPASIYSHSLINHKKNDVASVLQVGSFTDIGTPYAGQMQVLAKLLNAKYLQPQISGVGGAYDTRMQIFPDGKCMVSASKAPDIDKVLKGFEGMGNFLRNLTMTQAELDKFIIPAVNDLDTEFTEWCKNFGAQSQLGGFSMEDVLREREQILSTTVEELRGYADVIDQLMAEKRVFLEASETQLKASNIKTSVTENLAEVMSGKSRYTHDAYITGTGEGLFEPDMPLSRGEAAMLLSRVLPNEAQQLSMEFTDVAQSDWYYNAVGQMSAAGIMTGNGDGTFAPQSTITGEEFAVIVTRLGKIPEAIQIPAGDISRAAAVHVINAVLGRKINQESLTGQTVSAFTDVPAQHPYYYDILEASVSHTYRVDTVGAELWVAIQ